MSQQWYIRRQGQVYGPYTSSTLNVDSVLPTDELGQSQQGPWKPAASFASFSRAKDRIAEAPINLSEEHGTQFSYDEFIEDASVGNLQEENQKSPKAVKVNNPKQIAEAPINLSEEHGTQFSYDEFIEDASVGNLQEENQKSPKAVKVNNPKQWDPESQAIFFLRRNGQISKPLSGRDYEKLRTPEAYWVMIHLKLIHKEMVNFYDVEAVLKHVKSLDDSEWFECDEEKLERRMHALEVEAEIQTSLSRQNTARAQVEIAKMEGLAALIQILGMALFFGIWAWYFINTYL